MIPANPIWQRFTVSFLLAFSVLIHSGWLLAGDKVYSKNLVTREWVPPPKNEQLERWVANMFETDELWRIEDKKTYESLIDSVVSDAALKAELKSLYRDGMTAEQFLKATSFETSGKSGYVLVPSEVRRKVSRELLELIYTHQFEALGIRPVLYVEKNSEQEVSDFLKSGGYNERSKRIIQENTIRLGGKHLILITPFTWPEFSPSAREDLVRLFLRRELSREGLAAEIEVHQGDDLTAIAKKYAGERDYRPIERYLKLLLSSSESAVVPLEKIMHPFIRKVIDSYSDCHGPNCFNAGINVNRGKGYKVEYTTDFSLFLETSKNYRVVESSEPLQAGDLFVYSNSKGLTTHVSSYLGDGVVFTKNGLSKFKPYLFQKIEKNEQVYFPDGKYRLEVFRLPKDGEGAIRHRGIFDRVYYREHPELQYEEIQFNATVSKEAKAARLKQLSQDFLSLSKMQELIKLRDDPRMADFKIEIQSIISQNLKLQKIRNPLLHIGFNPFGSIENNREALEKAISEGELDYKTRAAFEWISRHYNTAYRDQIHKASTKFGVDFAIELNHPLVSGLKSDECRFDRLVLPH